MTSNWSSSFNGYWGGNSNSDIEKEILDLLQLTAISVGANIYPVLSNGNKASEANYLDERVNQDQNVTDATASAYLANSNSNGRRLIPIPIVQPISATQTTVVGYGQFLLYSNGTNSNYYRHTTNGNDPFCAIYAGPYVVGGRNPGVGGSTGASAVKLVQ